MPVYPVSSLIKNSTSGSLGAPLMLMLWSLLKGSEILFRTPFFFASQNSVLMILRQTNSGIIAYDCLEKTECMFRVLPYIFAADNPMQAEISCHCGLAANKFCRTCNIGGEKVFKQSDDGYLSLFQVNNRSDSPSEINNFFYSVGRPETLIQHEQQLTNSSCVLYNRGHKLPLNTWFEKLESKTQLPSLSLKA